MTGENATEWSSYPAGEKGAVLELSQVERYEERSRHENQREQRGVGLSAHRDALRAVWKRDVGVNQGDVFCWHNSSVCAVVERAAFQRVLLESLHTNVSGSDRTLLRKTQRACTRFKGRTRSFRRTLPSLMKVSQMKMREMSREKISWVNRETKRTRKLPSKATMMTTMMMSQKPIQTRPVRYSMLFALQNC